MTTELSFAHTDAPADAPGDDDAYDATRVYAVGDVLVAGHGGDPYSVVKVTPKTLWLMPCAPSGRRVEMVSGAGVFVYRVVEPMDGVEVLSVRKRARGFEVDGRLLRHAPVVHGDHVVRVSGVRGAGGGVR